MAKTAISYARISTAEQAEHGYSLRQQIEALRQYAESNGLEVLEEVKDPGHSGGTLERPGLNRIMDRVAAGGVSVVLAQDIDRIGREDWHYGYLKALFAQFGTVLRALDHEEDDTPEAEFMGLIKRGYAQMEKRKIVMRTVRGRYRRVREGKIIAGGSPPYGYHYNADRTNYFVHEPDMAVVRRIFYLVGVEGYALNAVKTALQDDGIPTPKGGK